MEREQWPALADHLQAEMARRGWYQRDLADHAGVSLRTVSRLINRQFSRLPRTMARIEQAVGWSPGTARRIVYEGYSPRPDVRPLHPWAAEIVDEVRDVLGEDDANRIRVILERELEDPGVRRRADELAYGDETDRTQRDQ